MSNLPDAFVRATPDTRPLWVVLLRRSLFQLFSGGFWLFAFGAAVAGWTTVDYRPWTLIGFLLAALSYFALLVAPARPTIRLASVVVPTAACGSRMLTLLWNDPIVWTAIVAWVYMLFIMAWVGPRFMPPPLSNGARLQWLREAGER